jgi:hypothetical protein
MGANRFLGLLNWFTGRDKTTQKKPIVKRMPRKPKYLITFEVQEREFAPYERETFILNSNFEGWLEYMKKNNRKINVIFMTKL